MARTVPLPRAKATYSTASFGAQVEGWARQTIEKQTAVLHQSIRLLVEEVTRPESAGGHMPVESGNLRNSVAVSNTGPVTIDFGVKKFRPPWDSINNAIAGVEVGTTAYIGFRAVYAHKAEMKHGFARLAAQRWRPIVDEAARMISGR